MHYPYMPVKNAPFFLRRFDTGGSLDISKDSGALAAATNAPAETPAGSNIWNNELTVAEMGADHIAYIGSAGDLRGDGMIITEPCLESGVAQGGAASSITLRAAYGGTAGPNTLIEIVRGTGKDQQPRLGTTYDSGTKILDVRPAWAVVPDNTSVYVIRPLPKSNTMQLDGSSIALQYLSEFWRLFYHTGTFAGGSTQTVLQSSLTGLGTLPEGAVLGMLEGTNPGFPKQIIDYDTATGQFTISPGFDVAPTIGQRFAIFGLVG